MTPQFQVYCPCCKGHGYLREHEPGLPYVVKVCCTHCEGTGKVAAEVGDGEPDRSFVLGAPERGGRVPGLDVAGRPLRLLRWMLRL